MRRFAILLHALLGLLICLAVSPVRAEGEIKAIPVADRVWMVQGFSALGSVANRNFISNAAFFSTAEGVVMIDALGSPALAEALIAEAERVTGQRVTDVLVTHYHADHVYGLQAFTARGVRVIAHAAGRDYLASDTATLRLAASRQELAPWVDEHTHLVRADLWIDADTTLVRGGERIELKHVGPAHTPEDLVVYLPARRVLFAGDLVFRGRIPFVGQADSRRWVAALDALRAAGPKVLVPGHGPVSTDAEADLRLTRDYLVFLREAMTEAAQNLEPFDEAYERVDWSRFSSLPLFGLANRMNAYNTYLLLERESMK